VLAAHVLLLFLLAVVATFLWAAGVETSTYEDLRPGGEQPPE
jgi:hypothetical protein